MEEKKGCFLLLLTMFAFWATVIVSCFDITSLLGTVVGIIVTCLLLCCFKRTKILLKITLIPSFGMSAAILVNFLLNVKTWVAILLPLILFIGFAVVISFFYEVKE